MGGQTDIQSQIDACQKEIDAAQEEYTKADTLHQQYLQSNNPLSPRYYLQRIQDILKKAGGWAERDSKLKGNRRNTSVTDDIITEICTLSFSQTYEELQAEFKEKKIYLYDDHLKIIYNINGKDEDISLEELESSNLKQCGQP